MAITLIAPAVLAAAAAAAIAFAPAAMADDADDLGNPGRVQQKTTQEVKKASPQREAWSDAPKGWTNEAQWARPGASNPFGSLPKPPVFALD